MTIHHLHRSDQTPRPFAAGPATTVAGWDGSVLATFTRHIHAGPGRPLTVVAVDGDLDQDTAPVLRVALVGALDGGPRVCCDISRVEFFGAAGINTVLSAHRHAIDLDRVFFLRGVHGLADRVLRVAGLAGVVPVEDDTGRG